MTHTKGPWTIRNKTEFRNQVAIEPSIGCAYGAGQEVLANATLMASAPELLEALESLVKEYEYVVRSEFEGTSSYVPLLEPAVSAKAAIAKAKGEV